MAQRPRVIIVGAGFGGLFAARKLANKPVDVLLIDRNNFHTFTPLIYQVATCALDPSEVAYPVRSIFHKQTNISFMLGEVVGLDYTTQHVAVQVNGSLRQEAYDYLIIAAGSVTTFFNNPTLAEPAFELKTLGDAVDLRNHILRLFERAAWTNDFSERDTLTTIVVVGGGPTGLETAGAVYELYNYVLGKEFKQSNLRAQVILIEQQPHLLNAFPPGLRDSGLRQMQSLGVKVILGRRVTEVGPDYVLLDDQTRIPTCTLIWSAGVKASPLATMLEVPLAHANRVPIEPTTEVKGRPHIFVVGDMAWLENEQGQAYPMLIPVAQQQGVLAARNILRLIEGETPQPFVYHDRGIMATIGRSRAVVWLFNRIKLSGWIAWLAWLGLHIVTLMGFRNRLNVLVNWVWNYFTYDRSVRIILNRRIDSASEIASKQTDVEAVPETYLNDLASR
jgi:NADH dehydrogenase